MSPYSLCWISIGLNRNRSRTLRCKIKCNFSNSSPLHDYQLMPYFKAYLKITCTLSALSLALLLMNVVWFHFCKKIYIYVFEYMQREGQKTYGHLQVLGFGWYLYSILYLPIVTNFSFKTNTYNLCSINGRAEKE